MNLFNFIKLPAVLLVAGGLFLTGCTMPGKQKDSVADAPKNWEQEFYAKLPMLGHRNWILVVDKAFPEQNAAGIEYIYANEGLNSVLKQVLTQVNQSGHVKPIIYQDKELGFITEGQASGVTQFKAALKSTLGNQPVQTMLHDSVFKKLDTESKLFKVLVIKTNEVIPYTSVFLQLDCAYWNGDKEKQLRESISK
ncbi:RbsD/FucU domain-containing protein [Pedobacter frigoris]|uniref:RbsD/FucU domain-containing protein n=1 Tax=Pedobacter frigoris TaxID=2571272 RepID=UPI00292FD728|nr:RbsD/FucU domain-containing protein [Pedobacter frigoris]